MPFLRKLNFVCFLIVLFLFFGEKSVLAEFTSGIGTSESPYEIENCTQLQDIGTSASSYFILTKNVDCSETLTWNLDVGGTYLGFVPISFYGNFDGKNYEISNLYINRVGETDVGLFGNMYGAVVKNFKLTGVNVAGNNRVGGIVGNIYSGGYATNISVGGTVTGINNVGGIIGVYNKNTEVDTMVENLTFNGSVIGLGDTSSKYVGGVIGMIGKNSSYTTKITFSNLSSFGIVDGGNASGIGGVIGYFTSDGVITNSYSESSVKGSWMVGGLIGFNMEGQIESSHATGQINGNDYIGGLVGALGGGTVKNSYATGKVTGKTSDAGGLVGAVEGGQIEDSYATGDVGGEGSGMGGLVGLVMGSIKNSYALGDVGGKDYVGGLAGGSFDSQIEGSYAIGKVTGSGEYVGGLVGFKFGGSVSKCSASGNVTGLNNVGGLVGKNTSHMRDEDSDYYPATVVKSYATGMVNGNNNVGGLVGNNFDGHIENTYATGNVVATGNKVGGLVGSSSRFIMIYSSVIDSYSTGTVTGIDYVGGLAGYINGDPVTNSFTVGKVIAGTGSTGVGGFIGVVEYSSGSSLPSTFLTNNGWYEYSGAPSYGIGNEVDTDGTMPAIPDIVTYKESNKTAFYSSAYGVYNVGGTLAWDFSTPVWYQQSDDYPLLEISLPLRIGATEISTLFNKGVFIIPDDKTKEDTSNVALSKKVFISVGETATASQITLEKNTVIAEASNQDFDAGQISAASLDKSSVQNLTGYTADSLLQWGIPGLTLTFDLPIEIKMYVGSVYNGQTLKIFRSSSVVSGWTTDGLITSTCIVVGDYCTFSTQKASYFTATTAIPSSTSSTSSTSNSSSSSGSSAFVCTQTSPVIAPDLFKIEAGKGNATLYFAPVAGATGYSILYGLKEGDERFGVVAGITNNNEGVQSFTINGLNAGTTYYFKVAAQKGCSAGPWSDWMSIKIVKGGVIGANTSSKISTASAKTLPETGTTLPTVVMTLMSASSLLAVKVLLRK